MKKHLHNSLRALFLSLAVLLSMPVLAVEVDGINYYFDAETKEAAVLRKNQNNYSGEIVIPESVEYEGWIYIVTSIEKYAFEMCFDLTSVTIPNSVEIVGTGAFYGCSGLTSVTIPNSVKSIGDEAFYECYVLTSVTIPNSVTSIGDYAFKDCSGLTSVTIPNSVTSIGDEVFGGCSGLASVTIPNSVVSIGDGAFSGCSGLTSVAIPNSVTSIGEWAFSYCSGLTSVAIPNSVTSIGADAFRYCEGLTSVTIGNSVESIGERAFLECFGLISVTIGNSVKSIGRGAFYQCSKLHDVYCYAEDVPSTSSDAFYGSYPKNATLHVPAASLDSYKATAPWSSFGKIVALTPEETGIDELKGENGKRKTAVYDLSGRRVQKAQKGIFIRDGKVVVK